MNTLNRICCNQPRKLEARVNPPSATTLLMRDPKQPAALLATVNIHESVFQRIAMSDDGYLYAIH